MLAVIALCWGISGSWDYNRKIPISDWKHDLRADASGYYIYLPGFFHHNFHVDDLDSTILIKAGYGFKLDRTKDRIVTKYFYGTALFESPFYLMAEAVVGWGRTDGFTDVHRRAIEAGGVFYWVLGLWLLATALQHWRPAPLWVTIVVMAIISFGSNLFYYAFRMPGYSHIYSFAMVCLAIWAMVSGVSHGRSSTKAIVFCIACALVFWIRPVDLIAIGAIYAWLLIERSSLFRIGDSGDCRS
ncbi:MAG: hypothetical protein IPO90_16705 [Flavobacteriales bacterium]|nr:hypothetical protein [Flavobacteriales bacterium]